MGGGWDSSSGLTTNPAHMCTPAELIYETELSPCLMQCAGKADGPAIQLHSKSTERRRKDCPRACRALASEQLSAFPCAYPRIKSNYTQKRSALAQFQHLM